MRLFFIPGFGEETYIFDKLKLFIPGEKVLIENWKLLEELPHHNITVLDYAIFLINTNGIQKQDVVIGHSLGGWVALQIKQLTGCRVIHISSWTNGKKVVTVPLNKKLMFWLARRGFGFNTVIRDVLVWLFYRTEPSEPIFAAIFNRLRLGNKEIVAKQLMIVYNTMEKPITVMPDLRIHAKADHIIRPPDQPHVSVPGDHFSLYTYPEDVAKPIVTFLEKK
jgi:pimeloyl-ACP methyl ester carboxylesterase